jgi:hypothetical protein
VTDDAPIAAVDLAPPPVARPDPVIAGRRQKLRERGAVDMVFAAEVADFLSCSEWDVEGDEAVARVGPRWCRVSRTEVVLGHDSWPGSKRIPL